MTMWNPKLTPGRQKYVAIADALERDIADGRLSDGQQLPTHRELADALGVTVGTVTRAYAEAERRGLTIGEVGRGTFVRIPGDSLRLQRWGIGGPVPPTMVDMRHSLAPELRELERRALQTAFESLAASSPTELIRLPGDSAVARHRAAGVEWFRRIGLECTLDEVLVSCGVQHGVTVSLMALLDPRDVLLAGEFTYPGLRALASMLGIRTRPVALDAEGMMPDALERACRTEPRPRALYIVPTIQNPTCGTLTMERRKEIARIAEQYGLIVIEDQIHALLPPERPAPIATIIPHQTVCLSSPSKSIAPGLRVGFVQAPEELRPRLLTAINSTIWTVPPMVSEVFSLWQESGIIDEIIEAKRSETSARHAIVDEYLSDFDLQRNRFANHMWLKLTPSWSEHGFVRAAREGGVVLPGAETFAIGRQDGPAAVRVAIGTSRREDLARGLRVLRDLLVMEETPTLTVI